MSIDFDQAMVHVTRSHSNDTSVEFFLIANIGNVGISSILSYVCCT